MDTTTEGLRAWSEQQRVAAATLAALNRRTALRLLAAAAWEQSEEFRQLPDDWREGWHLADALFYLRSAGDITGAEMEVALAIASDGQWAGTLGELVETARVVLAQPPRD